MPKTILVTGGARGIGLAITRRLACAHHRLAISYRRDRDAARALSRELSEQGVANQIFAADLSDPADARDLPRRVVEHFGALDVLVNNAGINDDGAFISMESERYRRVLATNLFGVIRLTGAALPHLLRAAEPAVVMIASLGGVAGKEGQVAYAASKGGLIGFTQWLGKRYSRIRVNAVAPGFINTDMTSRLTAKMTGPIIRGTALQRCGEPAEVADVVRFLLAPGYIQSTTLRVDGGFNR